MSNALDISPQKPTVWDLAWKVSPHTIRGAVSGTTTFPEVITIVPTGLDIVTIHVLFVYVDGVFRFSGSIIPDAYARFDFAPWDQCVRGGSNTTSWYVIIG